MRTFILILQVLFMLSLGNIAAAGGESEDLFVDSLFSEVQITKISKFQKDVTSINDSDKSRLLSAKKVLFNFLTGLQKSSPNALEILIPEKRKMYSSVQELFNAKFRSDSILSFQIIDFNILNNGHEIEFRYFLTETTEGTICTHQRSVALISDNGDWKVSNFGVFH